MPSPDSQVVQELHLVAVHVLCEYVDQELPAAARPRSPTVRRRSRRAPAEPRSAGRSVRTGVEVVLDGGTGQQVDA